MAHKDSMTIPTILILLLGSIDIEQIVQDVRALNDGTATEEEVVQLVAHLLDAAVPEEAVAPWLDDATAPLYLEASRRIVTMIRRRADRRTPEVRRHIAIRRVTIPAIVQAVLGRHSGHRVEVTAPA
jgi:hypothetical protein